MCEFSRATGCVVSPNRPTVTGRANRPKGLVVLVCESRVLRVARFLGPNLTMPAAGVVRLGWRVADSVTTQALAGQTINYKLKHDSRLQLIMRQLRLSDIHTRATMVAFCSQGWWLKTPPRGGATAAPRPRTLARAAAARKSWVHFWPGDGCQKSCRK